MQKVKKLIPGTIFVLIISYASILINDLLKSYINLEALTIAIIIGIIYNNTVKTQEIFQEGIKFSLKKLLKVGIVLLGFKLNFNAILKLGPKILIMVLIFVPLVLLLAILFGKIFKVNKKLSTLIGVGSCICGASAVVAMAPCINAEEDDSVIAVSVVSFLGAIGVLIYSAIAVSGFDLTPTQYGAWSGISLQGVAHAIAAAFALGDASGEIGTFVKMARVLMLVPVSLALGFMFKNDTASKNKVKFPIYVLYFIIAGIINSLGILPAFITNILIYLSSLFILMAMTAMGLSVDFRTIVNKGVKALLAGTVLFILLSSTSLLTIINIL
ncbi:YeiH family protein [Defluviitalea phaphyphila]|uniref:YeiH family protein n=1 Tax=Defluviitalea phaphyphila TaxID=1473580 RepID=UPI000730CE5F|nr:putative sulfate exporter family transporter [Defluviitalea phaphyphila]